MLSRLKSFLCDRLMNTNVGRVFLYYFSMLLSGLRTDSSVGTTVMGLISESRGLLLSFGTFGPEVLQLKNGHPLAVRYLPQLLI